jgi:hypothetical protein
MFKHSSVLRELGFLGQWLISTGEGDK